MERWNEELLLVDEEMRRVAEWYKFYILAADKKITMNEKLALNDADKGYQALLRENAANLRREFQNLPTMIMNRTTLPNHGTVFLVNKHSIV